MKAWRAKCCGKSLGHFKDEDDAARAYNVEAQRLGLYARLNVIPGDPPLPDPPPGTAPLPPQSQYRGVSWHKGNKCWQAMCCHKHLGCFKDEQDAARAYNVEARRLGHHTRLNVIEGDSPHLPARPPDVITSPGDNNLPQVPPLAAAAAPAANKQQPALGAGDGFGSCTERKHTCSSHMWPHPRHPQCVGRPGCGS